MGVPERQVGVRRRNCDAVIRDLLGEQQIVEIILPLALAGLLVGISQQSMSQSNSNLDEDLRRSQFCAKAAKEFRSQPEWKDQVDASRIFTSHFNKQMGKCLVKVTRTNVVPGKNEVLEMQHVYDALEGTVLGGKITTKDNPRSGDPKILSILMVRDGKLIGRNDPPDEAREAYQWFETLMKD